MSHGCTALSYIDRCMMQIIEANWAIIIIIIDAWCTALSHILMPHSIEPCMDAQHWAIRLFRDARCCGVNDMEPYDVAWDMLIPYWASIKPLSHIEPYWCLSHKTELLFWCSNGLLHWAKQFTFELGAHNAIVNSAHARCATLRAGQRPCLLANSCDGLVLVRRHTGITSVEFSHW